MVNRQGKRNKRSSVMSIDGESSSSLSFEMMATIQKRLSEKQMQVVADMPMADNSGKSGLYTGSIDSASRKPHGLNGKMVYRDNTIYHGQWIMGDWSGFGTLINSDGDHYEGGFFDNAKHGKGILTYANGNVYNGTFYMDKKGKGIMTYPDKSCYWGYFNSKSLPQGRGKFTYADGKVYDGEFEDGIRYGHGKLQWPDGRWYLGEWIDDQPCGRGVEVLPDGTLFHEGIFVQGNPVYSSSIPRRRCSVGELILYPSVHPGKRNLIGPIPAKIEQGRRRRYPRRFST